jgi:hypothetical protein
MNEPDLPVPSCTWPFSALRAVNLVEFINWGKGQQDLYGLREVTVRYPNFHCSCNRCLAISFRRSPHFSSCVCDRPVHWAQAMYVYFADWRFCPREQSCSIVEPSLQSPCGVEFRMCSVVSPRSSGTECANYLIGTLFTILFDWAVISSGI